MGQIISSDGKNDLDCQERYHQGIGSANQILSILNAAAFNKTYFQSALLFRNSMMINSMLSGVEALHNLTESNIKSIEACDTYLMKQLFNTGKCTPIISYYLETGAILPRFIIIGRRLMYLWTLLKKAIK